MAFSIPVRKDYLKFGNEMKTNTGAHGHVPNSIDGQKACILNNCELRSIPSAKNLTPLPSPHPLVLSANKLFPFGRSLPAGAALFS
jgi:hypothetical protein